VFNGDYFAVRGRSGPSSVAPEPERESRSRALAQQDDLSVDGVLHVLGGCV
jgi:hypothetical protein